MKALGIVQLVNKGEGLEAWRQLKLEHDGKSGNRQAALLRGILNPWSAWEADTRDGRPVLESAASTGQRVEWTSRMVSFLLRCWSKSLPMCEHRTAQCVAGYVSMLRRCGDTTGLLDLLHTKLHLLDRCRWMLIRPARCLDSRLARTGKGSRSERARARMARAKARARIVTRARIRSRYPNLSNPKDTAGIATRAC